MVRRWVGSFALALFCLAAARAGDWPQFRGPGGSGQSDESKLPVTWGVDKNVLWKVKVPGVAWSSPIVWGDKVFVTTAITDKQEKPKPFAFGGGGFGGGFGKSKGKDGGKGKEGGFGKGGFGKGKMGGFGGNPKPPDVVYCWEVHCLDRATGKTLWKKLAVERKPTIPALMGNSYASETPVTDGERVYAYFGMTGLFCYDLAGNLVWKKDLGSYKMQMGWGTGSSPALEGDRLFVQCDNEEKSFLVALDKTTGDEAWRVPRDAKSSWGTPFVWRSKGRTEVIAGGGNKVASYDPATGKVLWELAGVQGQFNASPAASEEMLYVGSGGMFGIRPLVAVLAGASGNLTVDEEGTGSKGVAWAVAGAGPSMASPLLYQGLLYIPAQNGGRLACYDAKTGQEVYKQRMPQARGITSSPWAYDGKVFLLDEDGQTFVVRAGREFKLLGTNKLSEMCWATPAVSGGAVFLRGVDHLYCVKE
jgi:outer membrane protein assembly factor BamB